ncbi:MAG TPA: TolC family protein [Vicinamibacterales bacterium]
MRMRAVLIAAAVAAMSVSPLRAQTPGRPAPDVRAYLDPAAGVTVEQAVRLAIEREPSLGAARAGIDEARGMRLQAGLRPNPAASFMQQKEQGGPGAETRVELQWPLDLFRRDARVSVATHQVEAARFAVSDRERLLAAAVRLQYGAAAEAIRRLQVLTELAEATSRQHQLLTARVDEGSDRPLDRDIVTVELRRIEAEREMLAGRVEEAVYELKRLLGMPASAPLAIRDSLEELVRKDAALPLEAEAAAPRADILAADARAGAAGARVDLAKREGRFDASLFGAYMRMDAAFMPEGPSHQAAAGVMVMLPVRNRNQGAIAAAEAGREAAAADAEAVRLAAGAEVAAARAREARARRALAIYGGEALTLAARNLDVVRQIYALGRATVFDVLAEQQRYLEIERAYTAALKEAYDARQELRRALGEVL